MSSSSFPTYVPPDDASYLNLNCLSWHVAMAANVFRLSSDALIGANWSSPSLALTSSAKMKIFTAGVT